MSAIVILIASLLTFAYPNLLVSPMSRLLAGLAAVIIIGGSFSYIIYLKLAEYAREYEEKDREKIFFEQLLEAAPIPILFLDTDLNVRMANSALENLFGVPLSSVIGKPPPFARYISQASLEQARKMVKEGRVYPYQVRELAIEGEKKKLAIYSAPVYRGQEVLGAVCVILDLTEEEKLRAKHEEIQELLYQTQKSEVMGRIVSNIAHDFNNMLAVILGNTEILKSEISDEEQKELLEATENAAQRARRLVSNLLAFYRGRGIEKTVIDLCKIIGGMKSLIESVLPESITFELELCEEKLYVLASVDQIEQMILNLVVNARDAMPHGGKLSIKVKKTRLPEELAKKHNVPQENFALIEVSDTGVGISRKDRKKVFEPFFTTKGEGRGSGLGLAIVHSMVTNIGGFIELESELGKGACFRIYLPLTEEKPQQPAKPKPSKARQKKKQLNILLVEDEEMIASTIKKMLEKENYVVHSFTTGKAGLEQFEAFRYYYDLVITDCILPDMDGVELYKRIRALNPNVKILFITGYAEYSRLETIPPEDQKILTKPFGKEELINSIKEALAE